MRQGFDADWPLEYDSPEEDLLMDLYRKDQIDIEFDVLGVEEGNLVLRVRRVEAQRPRLVVSGEK
jgi:hypothetical protein